MGGGGVGVWGGGGGGGGTRNLLTLLPITANSFDFSQNVSQSFWQKQSLLPGVSCCHDNYSFDLG